MNKYTDTLNLPKTNFAIKSSPKKEEELLAMWEKEELYNQIVVNGKTNNLPMFMLHDGPPYANSQLHSGHILNKVLKDIIIKYKTMRGFYAPFIPGFDTHGLPIEVAVEKSLGNRNSISDKEFREHCRKHADKFMDIQREQFKRLGVLGQWDRPYKTMDYSYEAQTLRELAKFADAGLLYNDLKPVYWCPVHRTALAEAEIEHHDHTSPSAYVAFKLNDEPNSYVVIWTTTPWTLYVNEAIALYPEAQYGTYEIAGDNRKFLVAEDCAENFFKAVGISSFKLTDTKTGSNLVGKKYTNPLNYNVGVLVADDYVKLNTGTGCVHIAPAHGVDDFRIGIKNNLEIKNAIDQNGRMETHTGLPGLKVSEANETTMKCLKFAAALLNETTDTITHKYPHSWRSNKPVYTRATPQWFVKIDKPFLNGMSLRDLAKVSIEEVNWLPEWGFKRIKGMVDGKPDWCLSRQRSWGVPLVSYKCNSCGYSDAPAELMLEVADRIEREGTEVWFNANPSDFGFNWMICPNCDSKDLVKGEDVIDVWFDSGVSFACAMEKETGASKADLYLEGSDQHRGWFNSSLFCSLVSKGHAPYRTVLTHGFVVDEKGEKLSKAKGNFIDPIKLIEKDGAEIFRLWIASSEFREDVKFSVGALENTKQVHHKIRNTVRYLISNLYDFDPINDLVPLSDMREIDLYATLKFSEVYNKSLEHYDNYNFSAVVKDVENSCVSDLSSFYFEVVKDELYTGFRNGKNRKSIQSALYRIAEKLIKLMAPIMCFTMEDAWTNFNNINSSKSIHRQQLLKAFNNDSWDHIIKEFDQFKDLRHGVNIKLEALREAKEIGSSLEAEVELNLKTPLREYISNDLANLFGVSKCVVNYLNVDNITVRKASGKKCERCWKIGNNTGELCDGCNNILLDQN